MRQFLPFIISGLTIGTIYGLFGSGLVLTYKTSGIFNFAHGALATVSAYFFYALHVDHNMNWLLAMVISIFVVGPLLGLLMDRIGSRLATQRTAMKIVGTIGIVLLVQALATIKYGSNTIRVAPFLPHAKDSFRIFDVVVTYDKVIVASIAVLAVILLYVLFRFTRLGLAMRAVVDDPDLVAMQATSPHAVRRASWVIGTTLASLSGVLYVSFIGVDNIAITFLVVQALGAAAIGGFASIPLTFIGALFIGVAADLSKKYVLDVNWLSGFPDALPFIVLFGALLLIPRRKLVPLSNVEERPPLQYRSPMRVRAVLFVIAIALLALVPSTVGTKLPFFTLGLCTALMLLSLGLLVRTSGQVSLCHATFAAIGAVAFSQLQVDHGIPWLLALLLAGLIVVPVGAIVAIPAIRLSGLFLALATLGFGILVEKLLFDQSWMFTSLPQGRAMPRPSFADTPERFYYVVLATVAIVSVVVAVIQRSRLGRLLQGLSESPTALTAMGLSINVSKVIVFCISAFIAGIAGILLGISRQVATGGDNFYIPFNSLLLLAMLAIAPFAEPWYALVPAVAAVLPGYFTGADTALWLTAGFGLSAILVSTQSRRPTMPESWRRTLDRLGRRTKQTAPTPGLAPDIAPTPAPQPIPSAPGITVHGLTVRFGGLVAVDGVSFEAPLGRITGLIGPNGAGKTTTFDACNGLNRRYNGQVSLHGNAVNQLAPAARGRAGLGRTFQRIQLCESLSVFDNVAIGREAGQAGSRPWAQFAAPRADWHAAQSAAWSALASCGIEDLATTQAGALPLGQRRLVELARLLAGQFDVLLLDEPSSGLDHDETTQFGHLLRRVVAERGVGILLVEHDMELVLSVCDHLYVLDFGRMIFEGSPTDVAASEIVQAAYLGSPDSNGVLAPRDVEVAPA